jgi:hypothetical protein
MGKEESSKDEGRSGDKERKEGRKRRTLSWDWKMYRGSCEAKILQSERIGDHP